MSYGNLAIMRLSLKSDLSSLCLGEVRELNLLASNGKVDDHTSQSRLRKTVRMGALLLVADAYLPRGR